MLKPKKPSIDSSQKKLNLKTLQKPQLFKPFVSESTNPNLSYIPIEDNKKEIDKSKQKISNNILAIDKDKYYNPEVIKGITSGDKTVDFLYHNQWLMDVPLLGNYIKGKAKQLAYDSNGSPTIENINNTKTDEVIGGKYTGSMKSFTKSNLVDQYFSEKPLLGKSIYKPTSDYLEFLPSYSLKGDFESHVNDKNIKKGFQKAINSTFLDKVYSNEPGQYKDIYTGENGEDATSAYKQFLKDKKPVYINNIENSELSMLLGSNLAGHKTGISWDKEKNLPYISVSDAWDFEPKAYSKKWANTDISDKNETDKINKKKDQAYIQAALMHKAGHPFKIYDRFYFDPDTREYIPDNKINPSDSKNIIKKEYKIGRDIKKIYNNELSTNDIGFLEWYKSNTLEGKNNIPYSAKGDYDYYSFYRNGDNKSYIEGHFPDTYKRPNHATFSNESLYSTIENPGGSWTGEVYNKNNMKKLKKKQYGGIDNPEDDYNDGNVVPFYNYDPGYSPFDGRTQPPTNATNKKKTSNNFNKVLQNSNRFLQNAGTGMLNQLVNPGSVYNLASGAESVVNYFDNRRKNKNQQDWLQSQMNTDNLYPANPFGLSGSRGDYNMNGTAYGQFRPDELGSKSPYGITQGMYYAEGGQYDPGKAITYGANVTSGKAKKQMTPEEWSYIQKTIPINEKNINDNLSLVEKHLNNFRNGNINKPVIQGTDNNNRYTISENGQTNAGVYDPRTNSWNYANYEYGGQANYGLDLSRNTVMFNDQGESKLKRTLSPIDKDEANIEAELGETIHGDFDNDGFNEHMNIGGKKHSQGGTPLNAPANSFIFSDTKKMKIGGEILKEFGKSEDTKKKFTPADLAKQYDVNKYKSILDDEDADPIQRKTAELMVQNYNTKLAKLALVQEDKKGFPNGIPNIAMEYLMSMQQGLPETEGSQDPVMRFGGSVPEYAYAGEVNPYDIDPYKGGKTKAGTITPTGKRNPYDRQKEHLAKWEKVIPGISKLDNKKAQALMYNYNLTNNPDSIKDMWMTYGLTAKGMRNNSDKSLTKNGVFDFNTLTPENLNKLQGAYSDGFFGVRQLDPVDKKVPMLPPSLPSPKIGIPPGNITPSFNNPPDESLTPNDPNFVPGQKANTDYWMQDKINNFAALRNNLNIKKQLPWAAPVTGVFADPTFYDPNRELAANAENMNTEMMYANQFAGPQGASYRNSAVSGNSATNAANILSKYNNMNVGAANEFAGMNAQFTNNLLAQQGARANKLFDQTTIANQQYDNAKAQGEEVIRRNVISAIDNKQKAGWINTWYPQYNINPVDGSVTFNNNGNKAVSPGSSSSTTSYIDTYLKLKTQYPNASEEVLREQAKQMIGIGRQTIENDGDARATVTGPLSQQMLNSFKFQ